MIKNLTNKVNTYTKKTASNKRGDGIGNIMTIVLVCLIVLGLIVTTIVPNITAVRQNAVNANKENATTAPTKINEAVDPGTAPTETKPTGVPAK